MRSKIIFVVEHFYPYIGGAEELFLNLTTSLVDNGYDVTVVTTLFNDQLQSFEDYKGVKIVRVKCNNRFLFTFFSLPAILKHGKGVDFIHTTSYNSAVPSFIAGLILKKKVIITFHEVWGKLWFKLPFVSKLKLYFYYIYELLILKLPFHKYIAVSEFTRLSLLNHGVSENRIIKIYNGIRYDNFKDYKYTPPEQKNYEFCFFGRLGISKGLNFLLEAFADILVDYPSARLKLIIPTYPKPLYDRIINLITELNLNKSIIILSNLSKDKLYFEVSHSSCVVIPSYSEGFCYVAAETMAMNIPIIHSGIGALKEVVGGKQLTLDNLDRVHLKKAMKRAIEGNWDQSNDKRLTLTESINNYLKLYKSLG